jgi:hypothetical protein
MVVYDVTVLSRRPSFSFDIPDNNNYMLQLSTRSIEPSFGLLFGDKLRDMGVATTGASVIMSTLDATINFSGMNQICVI